MREGWEIKKLGEVCEILNGFAFDSKLFTKNSDYIPLIRIRDIKKGFSETFYSGQYSEDYIVTKGEFLISMDGEFNLAEWKGSDALLNQRVCKISSSSKKLNNRFLLWFLPKILKDIEDETSFVTVKHLSSKKLSDIQIQIPPISEQTHIVGELDLLNGILDKKCQQLKELDSLSQSIFYDMFGDPIINNKGWEIKTINDICKKVTDGEHLRPKVSDSGIPFLSAKDITNGYIDFNNTLFVSEEVANKSWKRCCPSFGDIMIISRGATIGRICRVNIDKKFCLLGSVILLQLKNIESLYVEYLLKMPQIQSQFINMCGAAAQQALYLKDIKILSIPVPPITLQNEFADKIKSIERQKQLIKASIAETQTLLDSRMDYYFN